MVDLNLAWLDSCIAQMPPAFECVRRTLDERGIEITIEDYQKACQKMSKTPIVEDDPIFQKIRTKTVTAEDFNRLLSESMPESIRDRVRRRTSRNVSKSHLDVKGHQPMNLPTLADRVQPKRKPRRQQTHGRGALGHTHSTRTQQRKSRLARLHESIPERFKLALQFIVDNLDVPISECKIDTVQDKVALHAVATKLLAVPDMDRDWLQQLCKATTDGR